MFTWANEGGIKPDNLTAITCFELNLSADEKVAIIAAAQGKGRSGNTCDNLFILIETAKYVCQMKESDDPRGNKKVPFNNKKPHYKSEGSPKTNSQAQKTSTNSKAIPKETKISLQILQLR